MLNDCNGEVLSLFISHKGNSQRVPLHEISLDRKGILDDKFYDRDIQRSVLITSTSSYAMAQKHGIHIANGFLGENILVDCNPYHLPSGSQLQMGEVIVQISQNCTICNSLAKVDSQLPKILKNDRGIFAKVIKSGTIYQGDTVHVLANENKKITKKKD